MKNILIVLASLGLCASAFAQTTTYNCDLLKDQAGHALYGGPGYAVEISGQNVVLQVVSGADEGGSLKTIEVKMKKTRQEVEGASYEAQGVTASIIVTPAMGRLFTTIAISKKVGNETYFASCR